MTFRSWLPALALVSLAGCQAMELGGLSKMSDTLALTRSSDKRKDGAFEIPVRLISIWSDAVYSQPGQTPTRGFGGRLYFYNAKEKAVPVEGQLIVYAYEELPDGTPAKTPSRRFGFSSEQLSQRFSTTELGPSYSVWIPWDPLGGVRQSITLLPVFTSSAGHVVMGEQSINVLPGKAPENPVPERRGYFTPLSPYEAHPVRPTAYDQPPVRADPSRDSWQQMHTYEPDTQNPMRLRSTTIPLPMSMSKRLVPDGRSGEGPVPGLTAWTTAANHHGTSATGPAIGPEREARAAVQAASGRTCQQEESRIPGGGTGQEPTDSVPIVSDNPPAATKASPATPSTHFVRPRSPAPRVPAAPPSPVRAASAPPPATRQSGLPSPPPLPPGSSTGESAPSGFGHADWDR